VQDAPHLGALLEDRARTDIEPHDVVHKTMLDWRRQAREERRARKAEPSAASDGAGRPMDLHEFQEEFAKFALVMREALPPSQP
jgi:hypothetical protein